MSAIGRERWLELNRRGLEAFYRLNIGNVESSRLFERDGVVAGIVPGAPKRSVFNGVVYSDAAALREALQELARAYEEAGVIAWTVWVPEEDDAAAELLEAGGHRLDAEPRAMGTELDGFPEPDLSGLDWTRDADLTTVALVNDHAYGYPEGTFAAGMGTQAPAGLHLYLARLDGDTAATVATVDVDGDCTVWCVATEPEARGGGLATALMRQAMYDAAARGCPTTTLQATKLGAPVYERVGYGDFGAIQMWERRK